MNKTIATTAVLAAAVVTLAAGCASRTTPGTQPALGIATSPSAPAGPACPTTIKPGVSSAAASNLTMVPGKPNQVTICRYTNAGKLAKTTTEGAATATTMTAALNRAKPWPRGTYNCPAAFNLYDLLAFGYSDGHRVDVQLSMSGCKSATNGKRTVFYSQDTGKQVTSLVGVSPTQGG
jgi:hypothetical protein